MLSRIFLKKIQRSKSCSSPLQTLSCSFYHSYPDPNEAPIITQYQHNPSASSSSLQKKKAYSSEMIQQLANLKYRLSFEKVDPMAQPKQRDLDLIKKEISPQITKLENGLTVVSVEADDMTMSSFVFLIKSGRYGSLLPFICFSHYF